jgi:lipopolysaccharide/colanic/teichoic acid biosynthesis glycosyltransferase
MWNTAKSFAANVKGSANVSEQRFQQAIKRVLDLMGAIVMFIVLSPVLIIIGWAILLTDGMPVLFEWNVVGQHGRSFLGYKFRTMIVGADKLKHKLMEHNEMEGPVFKMKNDPRITPLGRFLRRHSLDELPQLWSVIKGDMSLVGPRPPLQYEYDKFTPEQKRKLDVKPGMTSLWHVNGKPQRFEDWLALDLEYIERWSLWLDVQILFKTVWVVLTGSNH